MIGFAREHRKYGPGLVMKLMANGSLYDVFESLQSQSALKTRIRRGFRLLFVDLLSVLNSFIHRDVKSANIMIDELYQSRVGDFSAAKSIEGSKQWTGNTWTSQYALPKSARMPVIPFLRMLQLTDH
jgi:serine/threonine protein kinase